jgi:lipid II:glycine glycyltransferase (peptidoglycan interpeptide bridge formation enzyme)
MKLVEITDRNRWDEFVATSNWGHPLQLWGWGEAKKANNWTPYRLALMDGETIVAGAQILMWPIPRLGNKVAYAPRGPVVNPSASKELLEELVGWASKHAALYLRIEPSWSEAELSVGWKRSSHAIQLRETYTIDLADTEEALLAPMSRKHRQYIRKAERDGVKVVLATGENGYLGAMYDIYCDTANRAGFGIHDKEFYDRLFAELGAGSSLYIALVEGKPAAFLWLARAGKTVYELYGGVTEAGQEAKANYFLKWTAILDSKRDGYQIYDFNGRLNEGVSRFKEGFGPDETDWIGTWDYPFNKLGYRLWERLWPIAKPIGRKLMKAVKR